MSRPSFVACPRSSFILVLIFCGLTFSDTRGQSAINFINQIVQHKVTVWNTDDGLPSNTLIHLHQDNDGYLWIGSYDGLIRFDGTRFTIYSKNNTPELVSFHARTMAGDAAGNIWIGTGSGLIKYTKGKFINLAGAQYNFFIESILVDDLNQKILIGTRNAGLVQYDVVKNTYTQLNARLSKDLITSLVRDNQGGIWVGSEKSGLAYFKDGNWQYFDQQNGLDNIEITSLLLDQQDRLYIGTTSGLFIKSQSGFISEERLMGVHVNRVKKDSLSNVWILTTNGVQVKAPDGQWHAITKDGNGISNNDVRDAFFDDEGTVWLATYRGGLNQIKEVKFKAFAEREGLEVEAIGAIQQLEANKFITATTDGKIYLIENGLVKKFLLRTPLQQRIYRIWQDEAKNLWIVSYDGLLLVTPGGHEQLFTEKDGLPTRQLRCIMQDRNRNFWLGSRTHGIIQMKFKEFPHKPVFFHFKNEKLKELEATFTMSMEEDSRGNIIVGSNTGGVVIVSPDSSINAYGTRQGLSSNVTYSARADKDGVIWVATSDGIGRIENGKVLNYTGRDGMPHETVFDILEDDLGYFWLPMGKGIIRVEKKQLNNYAARKIKTIDWKVYDKNDDLIKSECTGSTQMFKDRGGNMWFLMTGGLVVVNPQDIEINKKVPSVFVEAMLLDNVAADLSGSVMVPSDVQRFSFHYTALSLRYPKAPRYKYRLNNFDRGWIDAGKDNSVVYTNLGAGSYTFTVIASNNDGVWNTVGDSVSFSVSPQYYQTWWFYLLSFITIGAGIWGYNRWRIREIRLRAKTLQKIVDQRTMELAAQRDELVSLNEELRASQEEVLAQRDALSEKNDEIGKINANLEKIVADRTRELEEQNKKLAEYAFINAHKLRAPLASILGIVNLMKYDTEKRELEDFLYHLKKSSYELDDVVRAVNRMLERNFRNFTDE